MQFKAQAMDKGTLQQTADETHAKGDKLRVKPMSHAPGERPIKTTTENTTLLPPPQQPPDA
jgi:hypothetical protein